jgi:hypothetical protein
MPADAGPSDANPSGLDRLQCGAVPNERICSTTCIHVFTNYNADSINIITCAYIADGFFSECSFSGVCANHGLAAAPPRLSSVTVEAGGQRGENESSVYPLGYTSWHVWFFCCCMVSVRTARDGES